MATARDIMHSGAECIKAEDSVVHAARMMRDLHVGALPICGAGGRLTGIITDRDIAVRFVAEKMDAKQTVGDLMHTRPVTVDVKTDIAQVLRLMEERRIRRLPVLDGSRVVGMITEADLATHLSEDDVSEFAAAIYSAPPNN